MTTPPTPYSKWLDAVGLETYRLWRRRLRMIHEHRKLMDRKPSCPHPCCTEPDEED